MTKMTIEEARAAAGTTRRVTYRPWPDAPSGLWEYGVITSVNASGTVFVRYGSDLHSKGTDLRDLEFEIP